MSQKLESIISTLSELTVLEMSELATMLEEKWGVKAMAMAAAPVAAAAADAGASAEEEKTSFEVKVIGFDAAKKLAVIKVVREINKDLSLGAAKELVEKSESEPQLIATTDKATADKHKKSLEESGAKVKIS